MLPPSLFRFYYCDARIAAFHYVLVLHLLPIIGSAESPLHKDDGLESSSLVDLCLLEIAGLDIGVQS